MEFGKPHTSSAIALFPCCALSTSASEHVRHESLRLVRVVEVFARDSESAGWQSEVTWGKRSGPEVEGWLADCGGVEALLAKGTDVEVRVELRLLSELTLLRRSYDVDIGEEGDDPMRVARDSVRYCCRCACRRCHRGGG